MSKRKRRDFSTSEDRALSKMEMIANADYISSPYYRTYLDATANSGYGSQFGSTIPQISVGGKGSVSTMSTARPRAAKRTLGTGTAGYRRRKGFLLLMAIFMIAILGIAVLGYLGNIIPEYISAFNKVDGEETLYLGLTDPVMGGLKKFAKMDTDSYFYSDYLEDMTGASTIDKIIAYGMPIAIILSLLFALILFISILVGLFKKGIRKGYVAKKTRLGFLSFLLFLFALVIAGGTFMWNGEGLSNITAFITNKAEKVSAGYGLLGLVGLSLLNLIFSLCTHKKVKK